MEAIKTLMNFKSGGIWSLTPKTNVPHVDKAAGETDHFNKQ